MVANAQDLSIVKKVDDHYNHLKTLRTRYIEHYAGMGMDRTERGTLELAKPGRMRWAYDVPAGKLFDADNYAAWHGLHRTTLAAQDVRAVQGAAGRLNPGEWLEVLLVSN